MNTLDEMAAVIAAAKAGKAIEGHPIGINEWFTVNVMVFDFVKSEYRPKPEPPPPRKAREVWINEYVTGLGKYQFDSEISASLAQNGGCVGCVLFREVLSDATGGKQ